MDTEDGGAGSASLLNRWTIAPFFNQVTQIPVMLPADEGDQCTPLPEHSRANERDRMTCQVTIVMDSSVLLVILIFPNAIFLSDYYLVTHIQSLHSFPHVKLSVLEDTHKRLVNPGAIPAGKGSRLSLVSLTDTWDYFSCSLLSIFLY